MTALPRASNMPVIAQREHSRRPEALDLEVAIGCSIRSSPACHRVYLLLRCSLEPHGSHYRVTAMNYLKKRVQPTTSAVPRKDSP